MARTRQKSERLVSFYFRLPADLRQKIDDLAEKNNTSSARIATTLIEAGLEGDFESLNGRQFSKHNIDEIGKWLQRN